MLASLAHYAAPIRSLTRLLRSAWGRGLLIKLMRRFEPCFCFLSLPFTFQAKFKASQSKLKEKARSKILELQSKVDNLRAVLQKVTGNGGGAHGADGSQTDLDLMGQLLETPNRSSHSVSFSGS